MATKEKVKWTGAMVLLLLDNFQCQDARRFKRRVLLGSEEEKEVGYCAKNYKLMFKDWLIQNNNSNHNVNYSKFKTKIKRLFLDPARAKERRRIEVHKTKKVNLKERSQC